MNNDATLVANYLHNELGVEEKRAFEIRMATDTGLQHELRLQQQIMNAIMDAGLKNEFAKGMRKRLITRRIISWASIAAAALLLLFFLNVGKHVSLKRELPGIDVVAQQKIETGRPFINPPLQKINVPFSEYSFEAEKGETIYYKSGSVIYFPPSAFVDEANNIITGSVKINYREFADPLDFFVSGIPMQYDSAGKQYNFESSGMCEVNAFKDNKAIFVNAKAKPEINLSGTNKSALHNLYYLDTANRKWEFKGKDIITEIKNIVSAKPGVISTIGIDQNADFPPKPIAPGKADDAHQAFSIEVDPGSFTELLAYDRLKFEVVDESTYKRSDAEEQWESVKLDHTSTEGIYNVTFTNENRKVSYRVRPVLEGKDYDAALLIFKEKALAYERALKSRLLNQQKTSDSIALENNKINKQINDDRQWDKKMNAMILERNKKLKEMQRQKKAEMEKAEKDQQKQMTALAKLREKQSEFFEQQRIKDQLLEVKSKEEWKAAADLSLSQEVIRTFSINYFGVWNCDHPQYPAAEVPLFASFTDTLNNKISFPYTAVVYKKLNGLTQFPSNMQIRVIPGQDNMIWSILDSFFYYFAYTDFAAAGIKRDTKEFTFKMRKADKPVSSYDEIRKLAGKL